MNLKFRTIQDDKFGDTAFLYNVLKTWSTEGVKRRDKVTKPFVDYKLFSIIQVL